MSAQDVEAIRKVFEEDYPNNMRGRDPESYRTMYTQDALWIPPGGEEKRGIENVVEGYLKQIEGKEIDPTFTAEEIRVLDNGTGYVMGSSVAKITTKTEGTLKVKTVYFRALWKMKYEDGAWKIDRQMWFEKP